MEDYQIRALQLSFLPEREALEQFLHAHRLKLENDVECAFGIFSADERLLGCGCAAGKLLKCFTDTFLQLLTMRSQAEQIAARIGAVRQAPDEVFSDHGLHQTGNGGIADTQIELNVFLIDAVSGMPGEILDD